MSNEGRPAFPMLTDRVRISRRGWFLVVAVIIALLPFVIQDSYWRTNLIVCAINIMLAIGLDFILGYAGQLNLGHSAFYGIGAYASTLLIMKLGVPFWMAFVFAMVLSGAAGMALSIFAVRLRGHYLAIASLGFAVIVHQVLLNWISLTQGPLGIYAIKPPGHRVAGAAGHLIRRHGEYVLFGGGFRVSFLSPAQPTCPLADWRDAYGDQRGRDFRFLVRHQLHGMEGVCLRHRVGARGRCRRLLCEFRGNVGSGRLYHHRILHHSRHGDCRRHGDADRPSLGRDPADDVARTFTRVRRPPSGVLRRRSHPCCAVHAGRDRASSADLPRA